MKNTKTLFFFTALAISTSLFAAESASIQEPEPYSHTGTIRIITDDAHPFGDLDDRERYKIATICAVSKLGIIKDTDMCLRIQLAQSTYDVDRIGSLGATQLPLTFPDKFLEAVKSKTSVQLTIPTWPTKHILTLTKLAGKFKGKEYSFDALRTLVVDHDRSKQNLQEYLAEQQKKGAAKAQEKPESKDDKKS